MAALKCSLVFGKLSGPLAPKLLVIGGKAGVMKVVFQYVLLVIIQNLTSRSSRLGASQCRPVSIRRPFSKEN